MDTRLPCACGGLGICGRTEGISVATIMVASASPSRPPRRRFPALPDAHHRWLAPMHTCCRHTSRRRLWIVDQDEVGGIPGEEFVHWDHSLHDGAVDKHHLTRALRKFLRRRDSQRAGHHGEPPFPQTLFKSVRLGNRANPGEWGHAMLSRAKCGECSQAHCTRLLCCVCVLCAPTPAQ